MAQQAHANLAPKIPVHKHAGLSTAPGTFVSVGSVWILIGNLHDREGFGRKQQNRTKAHELEKGDECPFIALASSSGALISYRGGKGDTVDTDDFIQNLGECVFCKAEIFAHSFKLDQFSSRDALSSSIF